MDKRPKILDRVVVFAEYLNISLRSFSLSIGASAGYLHRLKTSGSNIGGDYIEKIIESYPQLNSIWLVTGEGQMIKKESGVEEQASLYGTTDFFKQALLQYLDDQEVKEKLIKTLHKPPAPYPSAKSKR